MSCSDDISPLAMEVWSNTESLQCYMHRESPCLKELCAVEGRRATTEIS